MRKQTLTGLCFIIALAMMYGFSFLMRSFGYEANLGPVSHIFYAALLTPLMLVAFTRLNRPLLAWRKTRGRDIEEEQRHEIEGSDIISLWPGTTHDGKAS
jgi:hypothetical protein